MTVGIYPFIIARTQALAQESGAVSVEAAYGDLQGAFAAIETVKTRQK